MFPKSFYLPYDIPTLVIVDIGIDVFANPLQLLALGVQALYHLVDGLFLHVLIVEADTKAVGEVELMGQVPEDTLEERRWSGHGIHCNGA